jgi:hypothetical protein
MCGLPSKTRGRIRIDDSPRNVAHFDAQTVCGLYAWLSVWYGITIPIFWDMSGHQPRLFEGVSFGFLLGWLAVCLTLMTVAQCRFVRAEV